MSAFTNLLGDIASYAGRGIEQGIQEQISTEGGIRRQARLFHAGKPLREAARAEEREAGRPMREQYGRLLGPILEQGGVFPEMPLGQMPSPERAEVEIPPFYRELEPDLAKAMLGYLSAKERAGATKEQQGIANMMRALGLEIQKERLNLTRERTPPPTMERDLEAEAERKGIAPEKRFEWKQGQRAVAAGQKAGATTTGKGEAERGLTPVPSAAERTTLATGETALQLLDKIEQQFGRGEFVGPLRGRYGAVGEVIPGLIGQPEAEFRANLSTLRNQMIKQITGAALSEPEAQRIMKQLPSEELPPEVFVARLKATRENAAYLDRVIRERFQRPAGEVGRIGKPAPRRFSSPAAVRNAVKAGKLTREQGLAILQQDFGAMQ